MTDYCDREQQQPEPEPPGTEEEGAVTRQWRLGLAVVYVDYAASYTRTTFPDGSFVDARPEDTDSYRATAESLGYAGDTAACSREHEVLHSFLMDRLGFRVSPTLYAVANPADPRNPPLWLQEQEEVLVLLFQKALNDPALARAGGTLPFLHGDDLAELRRIALRELRGWG